MVESVYDIYDLDDNNYLATNVFTAAKSIILDLPDHEVVEIIDADFVHLKKYDGYIPKHYEVIADAFYEFWHLHISQKTSINNHIIRKYLEHDEFSYMNGGFNVIGTVKTFKAIIEDIIHYSLQIGKEQFNNNHNWWQAMYGLNIACHNHKIRMIDTHNYYYTSINKHQGWHHAAHYCCDPIFNKRDMKNIDLAKFPDNAFYRSANEWHKLYFSAGS